jgi:hypothetical protein
MADLSKLDLLFVDDNLIPEADFVRAHLGAHIPKNGSLTGAAIQQFNPHSPDDARKPVRFTSARNSS